ncbi:MAG: SPOR domain-containing protein, partial [Acidobacteriota bacterium]
MGVEITRVRRKRGEWWRAALLLAIVCWGSLAVVLAQERWYTIQIASVVSEEEARGLLRMMRAKGIAAYAVRAEVPGLGLRYRIRYGRFRTSALA